MLLLPDPLHRLIPMAINAAIDTARARAGDPYIGRPSLTSISTKYRPGTTQQPAQQPPTTEAPPLGGSIRTTTFLPAGMQNGLFLM